MPHPRHILTSLTLLILLLHSPAGRAQTSSHELLPVDLETRSFPINELTFYLLDPAGEPTSDLLASDVALLENGLVREVISTDCPEPSDPERLSSVLAIDVSGSMFEEGRMEIARSAARLWVEELRLGYSEAAIIAFDHEAHLLHDFSTDRDRLLNALDDLLPLGGTSYNAGLLDRPFGAIPMASAGSHKRVVLFLTDGRADGRFDEMIREAREKDVTIHVLLMEGEAPEGLQRVARESGGLLFERISTEEEARKIFRVILHHARGVSPCRLTWQGVRSCDLKRELKLSIPLYGTTWAGSYEVPDTNLPRLGAERVGVSFGFDGVGVGSRQAVRWRVEGDALDVEELQISNGNFTLVSVDPVLPATLEVGDSLEVVLEYRPDDLSFQLGQITPVSNACRAIPIALSGGVPGVVKDDPLTILTPNGGERFQLGRSVPIVWEGSLPEDTVRLEYSLDGGDSWHVISDHATGNLHLWTPPPIASERCLVRAYVRTVAGETGFKQLTGAERVWSVDVSPSGSMIAIGYEDGTVGLHLASDGSLLRTDPLPEDDIVLRSIRFSPDESELLINTTGPEIYLRSLLNGTVRRIDHQTRVDHSLYSSDGSSIISAASLSGQLLRHDRVSLRLETVEPVDLSLTVRTMDVAGQSDLLLMGGFDFVPRLFRESTLDSFSIGPIHGGPIQAVKINHTGDQFLVAGLTGEVDLVSYPELDLLATVKRPYPIHAAAFSQDDQLIAVAGGDEVEEGGNPVDLLEAPAQLTLERRLFGHRDIITSLVTSPDGRLLVSGSLDSSVIIWDLSQVPHSSDSSDAFFALVDVLLEGGELDFGWVPVGESRDRIGRALLCNRGSDAVVIDSVRSGSGAFQLRSSGDPLQILPGACLDVEVGFLPDSAGRFQGSVLFHHGDRSTSVVLHGFGVINALELRVKEVDFRDVPVGDRKDSLVEAALVNVSPFPVALANPRFSRGAFGQFELLTPVNGVTLSQGDSLDLLLRFSPDTRGRVSNELVIEFGAIRALVDTGTVRITVLGNGICPELPDEENLIVPGDLHAAPGTRVSIPVLVSDQQVRSPGPHRFSTLLSWDASLLSEPIEPADARSFQSQGRTFTLVEGVWDGVSDTVLIITAVAGLGGSTETDVSIHSMQFADGCAGGLNAGDGLLRIDSICTDPDARLFFETERTYLRSPIPNPTNGESVVGYQLIEEGHVSLQLLNAEGAVVRDLVDQRLSPGNYVQIIDRTGLPAGTYWIRLQTETQDFLQSLMVL